MWTTILFAPSLWPSIPIVAIGSGSSVLEKQMPGKYVTTSITEDNDDMLEEYDFSAGIRGKYVQRLAEGNNLVVIDPDVVTVFPYYSSVHRALRHLAAVIASQQG